MKKPEILDLDRWTSRVIEYKTDLAERISLEGNSGCFFYKGTGNWSSDWIWNEVVDKHYLIRHYGTDLEKNCISGRTEGVAHSLEEAKQKSIELALKFARHHEIPILNEQEFLKQHYSQSQPKCTDRDPTHPRCLSGKQVKVP